MKRLLVLIGSVVLVFILSMLVQDLLKKIEPTDYQRDSFREMKSLLAEVKERGSSIGLTYEQRLALENLRTCVSIPIFLIISFFVLRKYGSEQ